MYRDMDILKEVCRLLHATKEFDRVEPCSPPDTSGYSASAAFMVGVEIESIQESDLWDGGSSTGILMDSRLRLTFAGRASDPVQRDEALDRLVSVAAKALSGQSLLGLTFCDSTKFLSHKWQPAKDSERRVISTFGYRYDIAGWTGFDTADA